MWRLRGSCRVGMLCLTLSALLIQPISCHPASHVETEHRGISATQRERRASGEPYWAYT
ncbi:hypothetical protein QQF64_028346, partial [Cirrhinus molitorella]